MYYIIYKTTNLINGKFYIGKHQTNDLADGYQGSGLLLNRAVEKYGIKNFSTVILGVYDSEYKMNLAEKILVVPDSEVNYNIMNGGQGGFNYINSILTKEQRIQMGRSAGSISGPKTFLNKTGIHNPEKRKYWASLGGKSHKGKSKSKKWKENIWITDGIISKKIRYNEKMPINFKLGRAIPWLNNNKELI